ncbi:hypothetical protein HDG37_000227 [Paraburkholderia sp. MM5384-R2]|nr:hypothetical protein [Paraburkholderia sp. MM5384-R2]
MSSSLRGDYVAVAVCIASVSASRRFGLIVVNKARFGIATRLSARVPGRGRLRGLIRIRFHPRRTAIVGIPEPIVECATRAPWADATQADWSRDEQQTQ